MVALTIENPLRWPEGWKREPPNLRRDGRYHFRRQTAGGEWTPYSAGDRLVGELAKMRRQHPT